MENDVTEKKTTQTSAEARRLKQEEVKRLEQNCRREQNSVEGALFQRKWLKSSIVDGRHNCTVKISTLHTERMEEGLGKCRKEHPTFGWEKTDHQPR